MPTYLKPPIIIHFLPTGVPSYHDYALCGALRDPHNAIVYRYSLSGSTTTQLPQCEACLILSMSHPQKV